MPQSSIAQQELSKVYDRINSVESKVDETNGYLRGVLEFNGKITVQNDKLIRQNARNTYLFFLLGLVGWLVVAYGAVGRDGLKSVRQTLPSVPIQADALPTHNDFDKYANNQRKEKAR